MAYKTIIVIGAGPILSSTVIDKIKQSYGKDIEVMSDEQAKEKGLLPKGEFKIDEKPFIFKNFNIEMPKILYDPHQAKNDCKKGWRKNKY